MSKDNKITLKFEKKIICFSDRSGNVFSCICRMPLINNVLYVYKCNAINNLKSCHVSYSGDMVFVQPRCPDDGSNADGHDYQKESIKTKFCTACTIKHNCGR